MIIIENTEVMGWSAAVRGMRNPMNSWAKSDSHYVAEEEIPASPEDFSYEVGENDLDLMHRLSNSGNDHAKYLRMLAVYVDLTAPLYWWKEFDTYKVGTVANSCSTMHKIHAKEFTREDFSCDHMLPGSAMKILDDTIAELNRLRDQFNHYDEYVEKGILTAETPKKEIWYTMIQLLPTSFNQKRTVMMNYQVLKNFYHSRKNHKLEEWHRLCDWVESLPHSDLITGKTK